MFQCIFCFLRVHVSYAACNSFQVYSTKNSGQLLARSESDLARESIMAS